MRISLALLLALLLAALAGCQPISPEPLTESEATTIEVAGNSFAPTGIAVVDALAHTIATKDLAAFADAIHYTEIPCTNAEGLGGPPPCPEGQPEGTVVAVLPIVESHLHFADAANLNPVMMLDLDPLYAVYEAPDVTTSVYAFPELEIEWPVARYVLVYPHASHPNAAVSMMVTAEGKVMRSVYHHGGLGDALPDAVTPLYQLGKE